MTSLWTTIKFNNLAKKNMFVVGPSGVGKTAIFRKLQKILDIPLTIFSVPGLSQAGYEGRSTDEILKQIYFDCDEDEEKTKQAIVILDEIDKIAYSNGKDGTVSTSGVQNELLKMVEGVKRNVELTEYGDYFDIDTSKIIFIGIGAFSELYEPKKGCIGFDNTIKEQQKTKIDAEKIMKYGLKKEFVGRFPIIVELNEMDKEILKDIIINSDESELKNTVDALKKLGVTIKNIEDVIDLIAEDALTKEIGARGLITTINNIFSEIFYVIANNPNKYKEVIIGENILKDNQDFKLIAKNIKRKTKKKSNI